MLERKAENTAAVNAIEAALRDMHAWHTTQIGGVLRVIDEAGRGLQAVDADALFELGGCAALCLIHFDRT
jgi:hypothetical protein